MVRATQQTILVCDDDPMLPGLLRRYLESHGYHVRVAVDGDAAVEVALSWRPDLILVDLSLPRRDGYSVLVHLRGASETSSTPVLVVSAEPQEVHRPIAEALGARAYVEKPFQLPDVLEAVRAALLEGKR